MLLEILVAILAAIIPIAAVWIQKKIAKTLEDYKIENDMLKTIISLSEKEMVDVYEKMYPAIEAAVKDGKISDEEKKQLLASLKVLLNESKVEMIQAIAPKAYEYLIDAMIKKAKSK